MAQYQDKAAGVFITVEDLSAIPSIETKNNTHGAMIVIPGDDIGTGADFGSLNWFVDPGTAATTDLTTDAHYWQAYNIDSIEEFYNFFEVSSGTVATHSTIATSIASNWYMAALEYLLGGYDNLTLAFCGTSDALGSFATNLATLVSANIEGYDAQTIIAPGFDASNIADLDPPNTLYHPEVLAGIISQAYNSGTAYVILDSGVGDTAFPSDVGLGYGTGLKLHSGTTPGGATLYSWANTEDEHYGIYFPDVYVASAYYLATANTVGSAALTAYVPPSVKLLRTFAENDKTVGQWAAPAGTTRGTLFNAGDPAIIMSTTQQNNCYRSDAAATDHGINPIIKVRNEGTLAWGQKTQQAYDVTTWGATGHSLMHRTNVRRLVGEIYSHVKTVGQRFVFEPNDGITWSKFKQAIRPKFEEIKSKQGLNDYRIVIDSSLNTAAVIANNIMKVLIKVQPTPTAEFLDVVISVHTLSDTL
jgi:hypothetical protein